MPTSLKVEVSIEENSAYKSNCTNNFDYENYSGFRGDVSVTLIDKTNGSNPTKKETYCM